VAADITAGMVLRVALSGFIEPCLPSRAERPPSGPGWVHECEWKAAFRRDELITAHGAACPMPSLLERLAAPGCARIGQQWDRCGVHYVEPIG
jgi:hypothetical protein